MSNFLNFIDEDIEAKKTLFSTMPTNTKTEIRKYNEKVSSVSTKYLEYKALVKKYIDTKSKSFNIKKSDKGIEELNEKVSILEHVRFILNPTNTYFEKMGFDNLLYQISNYYDFNFNSLIDIINQFIDKFELAGVKLTSEDFKYTCYVNEYMISFLTVRNNKNKDYDKVSEIFEKIYWVNPEIIGHIELNFRKLIKKYEKKFIDYISKLKNEVMQENKITNYDNCLEKLKDAYVELNKVDKEDITDIINLAKAGAIDINNFFEDSKSRTTAYTNMMINAIDPKDKELMEKFYDVLERLKLNIEEYSNYIKFLPLVDSFKTEYQKQIPSTDKGASKGSSSRKTIETQISGKEAKLEKINKNIFSGKIGFFKSKNDNAIKELKLDSIKIAKELYDLYKTLDQECFKEKLLSILSNSMTVSELLNLYYSFDYFKKIAIKKVFSITNYDELIKLSDDFDLFAMDPTNVIIGSANLFEESNVLNVIMNKYRLDNINLNIENLNPDNLVALLEKVQFLLRIKEIEDSSTTVEKIWFMAQVEKINKDENKKE